MSPIESVWLVVTLALLLANLPFISNRLFAVYALRGPKTLGMRLAEMTVGYGVAGAFGFFLDQRAGQPASRGWEFYAITGALFVTFSVPGVVYRYLFTKRN